MSKTVYVKTNVEIEEKVLIKFKELFPQHGSIKWFINECFRYFTEKYSYNFDDDLSESVEAALRSIEEP